MKAPGRGSISRMTSLSGAFLFFVCKFYGAGTKLFFCLSRFYIIGIPPPMPPPIGAAGSSAGTSVMPASVVSSIAEADAAF